MDNDRADAVIQQLKRIADALERAHPPKPTQPTYVPPPPQALPGDPNEPNIATMGF